MTDDRYTTVPAIVEAFQYKGNRDTLNDWIKPTDYYSSNDLNELNTDDWVVRNSDGGLQTMDNDTFTAKHIPTDEGEANRLDFNFDMADGDRAHITVSGWQKGSSAARAMIQMGTPNMVLAFIKERAEQGDVSIVTLSQELAALAHPK
jgi:hypothetical protein